MDVGQIFNIQDEADFQKASLAVFRHQYAQIPKYRNFCDYLNTDPKNIWDIAQIPFLPIGFFKMGRVITDSDTPEIVFTSSGTTGTATSNHFVKDLGIYRRSFRTAFERVYGPVSHLCILALLPSYMEREGSSLIYMMEDLVQGSGHPDSGFYLHDHDKLKRTLARLEDVGQKTLLMGVSFALLDLVESGAPRLRNTIVMETGGMKGRRKEMVRQELHAILKNGFGVPHIHSEYGMTELLSQAYSQGEGIFHCPPWMQVRIRETTDPLEECPSGRTGGINIIDLANYHSCSFIATQDLGRQHPDGGFEVLGRFDQSDIRGCNLLVS